MLLSNRFSKAYIDGVESFIQFAKVHSGGVGKIKCPYSNFCNYYKQDYNTVEAHLLIRGIMASYTIWLEHGELPQPDEPNEDEDEYDEDGDEFDDMFEDHHRGTYMEDGTLEREDVQNFENLLKGFPTWLVPRLQKLRYFVIICH